MAQEEKPASSPAEGACKKTPATGLSLASSDRWFNQLPVVTARSQFTGHNIYFWARHIQATLRPRNLLDLLKNEAPPTIDASHKQWVVEVEMFYIWIVNSLTTEMTNRFIQYEAIKEIREAIHKYH